MGKVFVLGAGMTGIAVGLSGLTVYEASGWPGGICSSYYVRPGSKERLNVPPKDGKAYRFEIGGGHWIFGGDPVVLRLIRSLTPVKLYTRKSAVFLPEENLLVPYPLQNNLRYLKPQVATQALREMTEAAFAKTKVTTMADWLRANFAATLCDLFFDPFHDLYTAGLSREIAPQDAYKSPVNLTSVIQGAFGESASAGYNSTFIYPSQGLGALAQRLACRADIRYGKRAIKILPKEKEVHFQDGSMVGYDELISTLPLNRMMEMTESTTVAKPDPSHSVLVVNIGAIKGSRCPEDHWVYVPHSKARYHRVGFYSNVDRTFLPASSRKEQQRVSIYVERAYLSRTQPGEAEMKEFCDSVVQELTEWEWIREAEVVDPTWIDVAYTWSWAGSTWKQEAVKVLQENGIYQIGRYGRWIFQGIADSVHDGLMAGASFAAGAIGCRGQGSR